MGSLQTLELNQQIRQKCKIEEIKEKSIALKSSKEKKESSDDEMSLLTKNFQKYIKKLGNKKAISNNPKCNFSKLFETNKNGIQCRECEGFGYIQSECANTLKKKKVMTVTWSDQDSEQSDEEENNVVLTSVHKCMVFFSVDYNDVLCLNNSVQNNENSDIDSDDSDLDDESLKKSYKIMYEQWLKVCSQNRLMVSNNKKFVEKIEELEMIIASKNDEINSLSKEIDLLQKCVKMLNPRSGILDDILSAGKKAGDYSGLGSNGSESSRKTVFVKSMNYPTVVPTNHFARTSHYVETTKLSSVLTDLQLKKIYPKRKIGQFVPFCHFCGMKGHIRPKCFSLLNLFKNNYVKHFGSLNQFLTKRNSK
ncbi:uncharacterized protein LOC133794053 [Humulus lupulus]|uniref:uncharacterized protein LOC133794053 n=1 Tax=Humulus lupulus TaxID=3486 RepID=UPI002B4055C3|nr:uncharacterized protein LOC133794053 [Humulus lupulus]XP_062087220.1 uncharacterized protein LOC133794053 [Humulus lupulus]XP_062087227.1 uncharacterized protein LOC133794053 [Humulus lupulus]XP_062087235.1 uncharacterized protein LOC133794053 [Humulus lupulus]XP_062087240.1 uncharacterized protein LOC133794053 [Humulus lupulus]XP_062087249.1 uncharacterized protein LOC133794053 [Humulus lupulus]